MISYRILDIIENYKANVKNWVFKFIDISESPTKIQSL